MACYSIMPPTKSASTTNASKASSKAAKTAAKASSKTAKAAAKGTKSQTKAAAVKSSKSAAKPEPTTTVAPAENTVIASSNPVSDAMESIAAAFAAAHQRHQQLSAAVSASRAELRALEKQAMRELRAAHKAAERGKRRQGNRSPSGFVKPTAISDELAKFLGKDTGTEMARTEVTRELNAYIRQHNLQDKDNGRKINADASLRSLLQLGKNDELTYFNLQKYMSPHFAKSKSAVSAAS